MIHYRTMQHAEISVGLQFCRAAGWNQLARDWELFLHLNPQSCCAAFEDDELIGTVATVSYEARFSWIGMMLVAPAMRRQGIGTQLMRAALDILHAEETVKLDATPVGREVYLKLGFVDEYSLQRMTTVVTGEGLMESSARLMTAEDLPKLHAMDVAVFGANRQRLLEWIHADTPAYAWVVDGANGIRGYCLGRHGERFEHLGPVIADDLATAQQLVSACLRNHVGQPFSLDAALHNAEWLHWLAAIGFTAQRPFVRMYRGANRFPGLPPNQFAILGPEFG
jgi:GNAT superfamily N-acetyltransferase